MRFGEVDNFWSRRGDGGPLFRFAGRTGRPGRLLAP